ncbi:MAG: DEAD/DEAH box helicase [Nitrososphaera sp.]
MTKIDSQLQQLQSEIRKRQQDVTRIFKELSVQNYKAVEISTFLSKPFVVIPRGENQWYVVIPKFIDLQIGWLVKQTESYNVFVVDVYSKWLYGIPKAIEDALDFTEPIPVRVEGDFLKVDPILQDRVFKKYKKFLHRRDGLGTIKIKPKSRYNLVAELVKDGILPFSPKPVSIEDTIERPIQIELRDYQREALENFRKYGSVGIYWMPSAGKTIIGLFIMNMLRGRKLIVVPTLTLVEQWKERIRRYTSIQSHEYDIITYNSAHKVMSKEYSFTIFDECHHLPANIFSRLALIKTKYRLGLSATPYREDGRNELIFALTGFPLGLDWHRLIEVNKTRKPKARVIITANDLGKITVLDELLQNSNSKTLIFCDSIAGGKRLATRYHLKFIYGQSKNRLAAAQREKVLVISRVGDEGISLEDLERVIEFAFLFGSRRQELQRLGRLFHSSFSGEHIILMTREEFYLYRKRLFSIYEKGIEVTIEER